MTLAVVERLAVAVAPPGDVVAFTAVNAPADPDAFPSCHGTFELRGAIWTAGAAPTFRTLDRSCGGFAAPVLATDLNGATLAAWGRHEGGQTVSLRTVARRRGGDFSAVETGPEGESLGLSSAALDGVHGVVVWSAASGDWRLFASYADDVLVGARRSQAAAPPRAASSSPRRRRSSTKR